MSDMTDPDRIEPVTRTCQIIVAALIMGVVIFLAIVLLLYLYGAGAGPGSRAGGAPCPAAAGAGRCPCHVPSPSPSASGEPGPLVRGPRLVVANGAAEDRPGSPAEDQGRPSEPEQIYPSGDTGKAPAALSDPAHHRRGDARGRGLLRGHRLHAGTEPDRRGDGLVLLGVLAARFPTRDRVKAWLDQQLGLLQEERQSTL